MSSIEGLAVWDTQGARQMAFSQLYGFEGVIARLLCVERSRIAGSMLDNAMRRRELTVGSELLALSFVDRFAAAITSGDWEAFFRWIDKACEKHGRVPAISRLLMLGVATIAGHVTDVAPDVAAVHADFSGVSDCVARIVERPRAATFMPGNGTLDEVDVRLDRLISRLTAFDAATAEHSRAVSLWCARIAKKMALSKSETMFVMRAGLIHDIGKVTTPPEILNAPHRLSDPDMEIMRRHAEAGAAIVGSIPQLDHLTSAVRGHHERIDGRGYPDGRRTTEIPLTVRIVSVADSFNAMIGNRPYRPPMAPTLAIEQLKLYSGTQFDSNVVNAMIDVVDPKR